MYLSPKHHFKLTQNLQHWLVRAVILTFSCQSIKYASCYVCKSTHNNLHSCFNLLHACHCFWCSEQATYTDVIPFLNPNNKALIGQWFLEPVETVVIEHNTRPIWMVWSAPPCWPITGHAIYTRYLSRLHTQTTNTDSNKESATYEILFHSEQWSILSIKSCSSALVIHFAKMILSSDGTKHVPDKRDMLYSMDNYNLVTLVSIALCPTSHFQ